MFAVVFFGWTAVQAVEDFGRGLSAYGTVWNSFITLAYRVVFSVIPGCADSGPSLASACATCESNYNQLVELSRDVRRGAVPIMGVCAKPDARLNAAGRHLN